MSPEGLLCDARFVVLFMPCLFPSLRGDVLFLPMLLRRKGGLKEGKGVVQSHTAPKWGGR